MGNLVRVIDRIDGLVASGFAIARIRNVIIPFREELRVTELRLKQATLREKKLKADNANLKREVKRLKAELADTKLALRAVQQALYEEQAKPKWPQLRPGEFPPGQYT
jgi:chromosome segregation ATPase